MSYTGHSLEGTYPSEEKQYFFGHVLNLYLIIINILYHRKLLLSGTLYRIFVRRADKDNFIEELGVMKEEGHLLWPWAPRMRCLNDD